jgi:N-acetylglucosamine malate deacetylase 1
MAEARVVLAVGAHPGSLERLCAGTLALLGRRGWRIALAAMTPGDKAPGALGATDPARLRREEAERGAKVIAAEFLCLEWRELAVFLGDTSSRRATALVRRVRPDLVLTHSPLDSVGDQEQTARIMRAACFAAPVAEYDVPGFPGREIPPPAERVPHLYYCDPEGGADEYGRPVEPFLLVDVGPAAETKDGVLAEHRSRKIGDAVRDWDRRRGAAIGCELAEGFRQHLGHGFPRSDLLGAALGPLVRPPERAVAPDRRRAATEDPAAGGDEEE